MAKRRKKIKWGRVIVALFILAALIFGIYKGIGFVLSEIDLKSIFKGQEAKNYEATVIIDAGHGGVDAGASHDDLLEKNVNLRVAQSVYNELEENNIKVILTRDSDEALKDEKNDDLIARAEYSQIYHADLFVSIHVNDLENDTSVYGYEVYYKDENSQSLGNHILDYMDQLNISRNRGLIDGSGLMILRKNSVKSIILELGYIHSSDYEYLNDSNKLDEIAHAISLGILDELNES